MERPDELEVRIGRQRVAGQLARVNRERLASATREAGHERVDVEGVDRAIVVHIGKQDVAAGVFRSVRDRVGQSENERIDIERVYRAVAVDVAGLMGARQTGAGQQHGRQNEPRAVLQSLFLLC